MWGKFWEFIESPIVLAAFGVIITALALIIPPAGGSVLLLILAELLLLAGAKRKGWFASTSVRDSLARAFSLGIIIAVILVAAWSGVSRLRKEPLVVSQQVPTQTSPKVQSKVNDEPPITLQTTPVPHAAKPKRTAQKPATQIPQSPTPQSQTCIGSNCVGNNYGTLLQQVGPPPLVLTFSVEPGQPTGNEKYVAMVTIRTNVEFHPVSIGIIADGPMEKVALTNGSYFHPNYGISLDDEKIAYVYFDNPSLPPDFPLVVRISSSKPFTVIQVRKARLINPAN
jgi:hypothetical protein